MFSRKEWRLSRIRRHPPISSSVVGTPGFSHGEETTAHAGATCSLMYSCVSAIPQHIWYSIGMDRTVRIQLHPTPEQAQGLQETLRQFTEAFNQVCRYGWEHIERNGVRLHHAMYYDTKAACPGLVSDLLIQARVKATEAVKSAFTWKAKREAAYPKKVAKALKRGRPAPKFKPGQCPQSKSCAVRYNVHTYTRKCERSI